MNNRIKVIKGDITKCNVDELLKSCYLNSLLLATESKCKTIAFPNISTGIYGYPKLAAAEIAVATVKEFIDKNDRIETVIFVCFDEENYGLIKELLN